MKLFNCAFFLLLFASVTVFGCTDDDQRIGEPTDGGSTDTDTDIDTDTDADTDSDTSTDDDAGTDDCVPTETGAETICDMIDNNCDGKVDNVDAEADGICDCLNIGIVGDTGYAPTANFEAWLTSMGTSVDRYNLSSSSDIITSSLLDGYHVLLIDRVEREMSAAEALAVEEFVKTDGFGMITLIGYNFDSNNPSPERTRANSVLEPFGLAYQGDYQHVETGVMPTFISGHPISDGIAYVNYQGGMAAADLEGYGTSEIFATVPTGVTAGLAHQTADEGGRVVMWGDEWITFDSDWSGYADVETFWSQMLAWVQPTNFCQVTDIE